MKYFGRLRVRRVYRWSEEPLRFNRKLKTFDYRSLAISVDGLPGVTVITTGQHILIEGKDEDSPYVARVMRLFGDESGKQKKASIRWFIRTSEIPTDKLKLLGREPHTQEIFYYQSLNCEEEVDVESILRPVQVKSFSKGVAAPFPDSDGKDTLYVKLSWDCKAFMEVDSTVVESMSEPALTYSLHPHASRRKPSLPPLLPCSPPAAAPASRAPSCHALPMPDPSIMHRAASGEASGSKEESPHCIGISNSSFKAAHPLLEQDASKNPKQEGKSPYSGHCVKSVLNTQNKTTTILCCFLFPQITISTPRTPRHATPSIPSRSLPARQPANVLEEARARLHVSSVPESLPCREQEFQDVYSFVESKIIDGTGGCMYISGVPGTGKTATIHEVMRCLQHAADVDEIPPFHFIEINGMKMTDPHQAYVQILQKLTGEKATADHAAVLLEKRFSNPAPKKKTTVLLVDELDLLWTRKQNVMYNLFDWPTRRHAHLVVLTIANTMDLPERIMINRVASRLGLTRMSFQPYSFKQLQQIITSRLNKVKAFEEDALQLVSRKVAALSGDARRCLDICRRATEICEHSSTTGLVGMCHVMEALNEMFSSAYITAIKWAAVQEQLFLRAVIAEFRRLGLEEATFQQVFVQHQALCRVEGLQPISVSEGMAVCQRLGACRLLLLESSRHGVLQRVRLNVSQDDVLYALKAD
uniref:Origin recognition complex subunit 1 n=1 Tax=Echeneis naucrates TaxID=173247 RepID=A0A665VZY6_ECHNA